MTHQSRAISVLPVIHYNTSLFSDCFCTEAIRTYAFTVNELNLSLFDFCTTWAQFTSSLLLTPISFLHSYTFCPPSTQLPHTLTLTYSIFTLPISSHPHFNLLDSTPLHHTPLHITHTHNSSKKKENVLPDQNGLQYLLSLELETFPFQSLHQNCSGTVIWSLEICIEQCYCSL